MRYLCQPILYKYLHRITFRLISNSNSSQVSAVTISLFDICFKIENRTPMQTNFRKRDTRKPGHIFHSSFSAKQTPSHASTLFSFATWYLITATEKTKGRYVFNWGGGRGGGLGYFSPFFWIISWPSPFPSLVNTWPSPITILPLHAVHRFTTVGNSTTLPWLWQASRFPSTTISNIYWIFSRELKWKECSKDTN